MTQPERSIAEIAADAIMALETLLRELEDDRLITMALHVDAGPSYAYLAMAAENEIARRKTSGEWEQ